MLGVEPNEWFEINDIVGYEFKIDDDLLTYSRSINGCKEYYAPNMLRRLLKRNITIKQFSMLHPNEQVAIRYAKTCGCKWLAKDKDNTVNAFVNKPVKNDVLDIWDLADEATNNTADYVEINIPIPFISWEDEEPYYIGD